MVLLEAKDISMYYRLPKGWVKAVDKVTLNLERGDRLGLVGESGCGKTSLGLSILRVLPSNGKIIGGQLLFEGVDLLKIPEDEMRRVRWDKISMIFQNAMNALNPVVKVEGQLIDALQAHKHVSREEAKRKISELFKLVDLTPQRMNNYPHELSGGMKQRVVTAMGLICDPEIVIADEPTTALDTIVQDRILQKILNLQKELNFALLMISHDMSVILEICDKIGVMYGGKIVEYADSISIFKDSHHPYTISLIRSIPSILGARRTLTSLSGQPPNLLNPPLGCRFEPRCPLAKEICKREEPPPIVITNGHYSCCHFALDRQLKEIKFEAA